VSTDDHNLSSDAPAPLLEVSDLTIRYANRKGNARAAVDGVSLTVPEGAAIGIVGESGCGKSSLARAIVGLVAPTAGSIRYAGQEVTALDHPGWLRYRREVQMVFQDTLGSLNPRQTAGDAIVEVLAVQRRDAFPTPESRRNRLIELLDLVELPPRLAEQYPHELSGGQRQRIALARALAMKPRLLIADEPVSALDVAVQAQIIRLLDRLRRELHLTLLFIAHDLAVVRVLCPVAHVMNQGKIVESGATADLFSNPQQAYTRSLLAAVPDIDRALSSRQFG